jgi:DNA-directed RNA polymerase II subunit RPB1
MSTLLYTSNITSVRFSLANSEGIKSASHATVVTHEMYSADKPYVGGVCDGHLGTVDENRCLTCGLGKKLCIGHAGDYVLKYPVYNPLAWESVGKWLRIVCHECGECVYPPTKLAHIPRKLRLQNLPTEQKGKNRKCPKCNALRPHVRHDDRYKMLFLGEIYAGEETKVTKIYPHHVAAIFARISDDTVARFGLDPISHPRSYVLSRITVPAIVIRPDVRKVGGSGATDDVTTTLQAIIRDNAKMPTGIPDVIGDKLEKAIFDLTINYYNIVRASGEGSMSSLAKRFKGKPGLIRRNQLGKRVRNMARSTITGDPTLAVNEVGVPLVFAQIIQMEETVQQWNKARLMTYVHNGRVYPGATKIRKRATGVEYDIDPSRDIEVDIGDVIMRDLIDGDIAGFNRQPSLAHSAISGHVLKITRNPGIKTLRMNVIACKLYNADLSIWGLISPATTY